MTICVNLNCNYSVDNAGFVSVKVMASLPFTHKSLMEKFYVDALRLMIIFIIDYSDDYYMNRFVYKMLEICGKCLL